MLSMRVEKTSHAQGLSNHNDPHPAPLNVVTDTQERPAVAAGTEEVYRMLL